MAFSAGLLFWVAWGSGASPSAFVVTVLFGGLLAPFAKDLMERIAGARARVAR
jgi:hypothetical protein